MRKRPTGGGNEQEMLQTHRKKCQISVGDGRKAEMVENGAWYRGLASMAGMAWQRGETDG